MSVLINMEMPKACVYRENGQYMECPLYDTDGYCGAINKEASHKEGVRDKDCPLAPVPKHGRLIDADALLNSKGVGTQIAGWGKMYHETCIEYAPTIIPASEEGE